MSFQPITSAVQLTKIDKPTSAWGRYTDAAGNDIRLPYVDFEVPETHEGIEISRAVGLLCSVRIFSFTQGTPVAQLELHKSGNFEFWICTSVNVPTTNLP